MKSCSESRKSLCWVPKARDCDALPFVPDAIQCDCGYRAPISHSNAKEFVTPSGYMQGRLRVCYHCKHCQRESVFRLGLPVVDKGLLVHTGESWWDGKVPRQQGVER